MAMASLCPPPFPISSVFISPSRRGGPMEIVCYSSSHLSSPLSNVRRTFFGCSSLFRLIKRHFSHSNDSKDNVGTTHFALQTHSFSSPSMSQRSDVSSVACKAHCTVIWSIEADITDGVVYVTGGLDSLGCWDPHQAIPFSRSLHTSNLWETQIKVPWGINFKYNYVIRHTSSVMEWRPGPEYSLSVPVSTGGDDLIRVMDCWMRESIHRFPLPSWGSWLLDSGFTIDPLAHPAQQALSPDVSSVACKAHCTILWSIEADITDGVVYVTGGPVSLGRWDPHQAIPFSRSLHTSNLWETQIEVPWGINFKYNYIIRHTSSVIEWRPGPEYSLSVPVSTGGDDFIRVRDYWMRESIHRFPLPSWGSWLLDSGFTIDPLTHPAQQALSPGEQEILENKNGTTRKDDHSIIQINGHDCIENSDSKLQRQKYGLDFTYAKLYSLLEEQKEAVAARPPREVEVGSTVILVNSSLCTMQRIAVLEEGKLVELLLESEKDKVQKDDIYLGVITKLVPCSKRAFVDIGMKQGFMEIKQSIKPFVYTTGEKEEEREEEREEDLEGVNEGEGENIEDEFGEDVEVADSVFEPLQGGNNKKRNQWVNVKKGTKIIVQVKKEELPKKGPKLTPYPRLSSRFLVLDTEKDKIGVSGKISGSEKTRLKLLAKKGLRPPPGIGLVVRTAAAGHSLEELLKELYGLLSTWKEITECARSAARAADEGVEGAVPVLLHGAMPQTLSVVQDLFNDKVKSMVVDSPRTYHEVMSYLQEKAPELCERVELYDKRTPIFDEYKIEEEINGILSKRVALSNGGSLVIEQTEALVSIDVNSGSSVFGEGDTAERAALDVNLLAAKQIARVLRLRDLGGIIVVDFIKMSDKSSIRKVFEEMTKAVKRDRSKVKVYELSDHGLMELSRKRVRPSVPFMISQPCICCPGTGRVEALEMSFMKIENHIRRFLASSNHRPDPENPKTWPNLMLRVDKHVNSYLRSGNSIKLAVLSVSLNVRISLKRVDAFSRGKFELLYMKGDQQEIIDISALQVRDTRTKSSSGPFRKKNLRSRGHFPNKNLRSRGHFLIKKLKSGAT